MTNHLISQDKTVLEALTQINNLGTEPLVLFVVDKDSKMVGTLTDGDARRAMIAGYNLTSMTRDIMHKNFNYLRQGIDDNVEGLHRQKELKMKLVPILDENNHILDIVDLEKYKTKLPIDAVIMAGGKGERLRPLTEKTPKPLLNVGNKAIIDYNVDNLISYGVRNIYVTVNYLKEQLEEHYLTERNGIKIQTIREPKYLGTIGSIQFISHFCNDTVLLMNSDLFTNIDFEDFYLHFQKNNAAMSVAAVPYTINIPYGIFSLDGRNINGVLEKPTYNYYANAGIYLFKKRLIEEMIPKNKFFNATDFMQMIIAANKKVIRYPLTGYWIDIGNRQEYEKAQDIAKHLK